jgi:CubicO group peptidase (beta-lactamase class C family)
MSHLHVILQRSLLIACATLLFGCGSLAQKTPPADAFAAVAPRMQAFVDQGQISGIVTLVATKDNVLHLAAVGKSDLASGRPMKSDDLFWIASMTKPLTAISIAMLQEEGKLSFDDPVSKFIPEFANLQVSSSRGGSTSKPSRQVTLRDLLTHTSGLGELANRAPHQTLEQTATLLAQTTLRFDPGTRWSYSTAGMDTLGRIVEIVSGQAFDQFLQQRLFDPLGMKNATFALTPQQDQRFAHNYRMNAQTNQLEEISIPYLYGTDRTDRQRAPSGGAGLFCTAEDIARVYQMMLNKGRFNGRQILKPLTVAEMTRKQTGSLSARPGMPWGLGFCIIEDPAQLEANHTYSPGSFGHGGAHGTSSWADPKTGLIHVIMLQRAGLRNPDNSDMRIAFEEEVAKALNH